MRWLTERRLEKSLRLQATVRAQQMMIEIRRINQFNKLPGLILPGNQRVS